MQSCFAALIAMGIVFGCSAGPASAHEDGTSAEGAFTETGSPTAGGASDANGSEPAIEPDPAPENGEDVVAPGSPTGPAAGDANGEVTAEPSDDTDTDADPAADIGASGTAMHGTADAVGEPVRATAITNGTGADAARAVGVAGATGVTGAATQASLPTMQRQIVNDTNRYRKSHGRPALSASSKINAVAQAWAKKQAAARSMSHNPRYSTQIPTGWHLAGENVAYGYGYAAVTKAWYNSEGHRRNMLGGYNYVGIGVAYASDGTAYYSQVFGAYKNRIPGDTGLSSTDGAFADVWKSDSFYTEINWMYSSGLSTGTKSSVGRLYKPGSTVSRSAMAAFLYRLNTPKGAAGPKGYAAPSTSPFADVPRTHKLFKEIAWMHASGLSKGTAQRTGKPFYQPDGSVTRSAMAAFLYRLESPKGYAPTTKRFVDVPKTHSFYKQISWMYDSGLSKGTKSASGRLYHPKGTVTRGAMAAFLYRLQH